jgi:hypothetical protein
VTVDLSNTQVAPVDLQPALAPRWVRGRGAQFSTLTGILVILSAAWIAMLFLLRAQGVTISGDEPHYLVEAISIGRFHTLNMNPGYVFAVEHHWVYPWTAKPSPHLAAIIGQAIFRHNLYLPFHAIGLSVLLAVPMFLGTTAAVVTLITLLALLTVVLVYITGEVSQVRSPARNLIALLFLAPAFILATDQVFPDLISGLVIAIVIMTIAQTEIRRRCPTAQLISVTMCLVILPWLDQKNVFFPLPLLLAFLVAGRQISTRSLRLVVVPALVSLGSLLLLNLYEFGHLLGGPQQVQLVGLDTLTRSLALLVDRRQGLIVQLPIALLGIAGLWHMRKKVPIAVITSVFILAATIYGNGSQPDSFGGYSFVGRFQWPVLPILLAFAGLYIIRLWQVRPTAVIGVVAVSLVIFLLQFLLILHREHVYYNLAGWDPLSYAGWWGGLDPSPVLGLIGTDIYDNSRVDWGIVCVVAIGCLIVYALVQAAKQSPRFRPWVLGCLSALVLLSFPMTLSATPLQPEFAPAASYVAVAPSRICDTRPGHSSDLHAFDGQCSDGSYALQPRVPITFAVAGRFGVPSKGVTAVALNVTATDLESSGTLTLFPAGEPPPTTPTFFTYLTVPTSNLTQVGVGPGGAVSISSSVEADAAIEIEGYFTWRAEPGTGLYHPLPIPARLSTTSASVSHQTQGNLCQSRSMPEGGPVGPRNRVLGPGTPVTLSALGPGAIATSPVTAVLLRLTAIDPQSPGVVSVAGRNFSIPVVTFSSAQSATNSVIVPLGSGCTVTVMSTARTGVAVDAVGYFGWSPTRAGAARFTPEITPVRICDSRGSNPSDLTGPYAQCNPDMSPNTSSRPIGPHETRTIQVSGLGYVPSAATAVELIVTPAPPSPRTALAVAGTRRRPGVVPFPPRGGYADGPVVAPLSKNGRVTIVNVSESNINVVIDLIGWYSPPGIPP